MKTTHQDNIFKAALKIEITTLDNGNKEVSLPELIDRLAVSDEILQGVDHWDIMRGLFAPSKFTHFNAKQSTFLKELVNDSSCFATKIETLEDGSRLVIGDFWVSDDVETCVNRLADGESIIYNLIKF